MLRPGETPGAEAILGDVRDAVPDGVARIARAQLAARDAHAARGAPAQARDRLRELALPVAGDARDRQDLARAQLERDVVQRALTAIAVALEPRDVQHRLADLVSCELAPRGGDLASDHQGGERVRARLRRQHRPDRASAAQDGHPVRDRHHLVQLVRDEDDGAPLCRHLAQGREQRVDLLRRQHRRRLVQDQHARVAVQRLEDLDALLLADRELPDARVGLHRQPVALGELGDLLLDLARVQREARARPLLVAEQHVLGDGERLDEAKVLVHHRDAGRERVTRGGEAHRLAPQLDRAGVGLVEPGQDVRERALARAVLAEQRVHLADRRPRGRRRRSPARRESAS